MISCIYFRFLRPSRLWGLQDGRRNDPKVAIGRIILGTQFVLVVFHNIQTQPITAAPLHYNRAAVTVFRSFVNRLRGPSSVRE